jgi:hypothetical protein
MALSADTFLPEHVALAGGYEVPAAAQVDPGEVRLQTYRVPHGGDHVAELLDDRDDLVLAQAVAGVCNLRWYWLASLGRAPFRLLVHEYRRAV